MIYDKYAIVFDTSDKYIAAALYRGKENIHTKIELMAKGQAETLMLLLDELLATSSLNLSLIHISEPTRLRQSRMPSSA